MDRTHWEGCWRDRAHHECAVAKIERLEAEGSKLLATAEEQLNTLDDLVQRIEEWEGDIRQIIGRQPQHGMDLERTRAALAKRRRLDPPAPDRHP